jgi:CHAT domain-containing protein
VLVQSNGKFLLERFTIATTPAGSIAVQLWERSTKAATSRMAVLADPRFEHERRASASAETFRSAMAGTDGLPRLRGSGREARAVARYADQATVLRRKKASESWLKSAELDQFAVVHFATHALVDEGSLSNTALALAPGGSDDGFVHAGELANLDLSAELVVLSACRTAGGAIVRGEGVQGLAAPLLAAGARAIAATWWPIGDIATRQVVDDFYREMASGQKAGDALRTAKLAALKRGEPPSVWAAFTLVGDPFARPPLQLPSSPNLLVPLLALAGVMILATYGVVRRRRRVGDARVPSRRTATTHQR